MQKAFKRKFLGLALVFALATVLSGCQTTPTTDQTEPSGTESDQGPIKIGAISALTGNASVYGAPAARAIELAIEEINKNGGILGRQLELILEDGMCDAKTAANATNKLINIDQVKIILGGHCSTESLTIAPVANENKVIQMASITSSNKYTDAGDYSFRNWPASDYYVGKLADFAYEKGARKLAILHEQKEFPVSAMESFKNRFEELGGEVLSEQAFLTTETDYRSYLTKIKSIEDVDTIFFSVQGDSNAAQYFKTLKELDMIGKYQLYTNNDPVTKKIYDDTGGLNKNVYTTDGYVDPERPDTKELLELYKNKYGEYPQTNTYFVASSYDALFTIKDGIEHCNGVDTECIKDFLYTVKDWEGTAGKLTIDENGDAMTSIGLHYFDDEGNEIWEVIE